MPSNPEPQNESPEYTGGFDATVQKAAPAPEPAPTAQETRTTILDGQIASLHQSEVYRQRWQLGHDAAVDQMQRLYAARFPEPAPEPPADPVLQTAMDEVKDEEPDEPDAAVKKGLTVLRKAWGTSFDSKLAKVKRAVRDAADETPGLLEFFAGPLGNDPAMIQLLHAAATNGGYFPTPSQTAALIRKIMRTPEYLKGQMTNPVHRWLVDELVPNLLGSTK